MMYFCIQTEVVTSTVDLERFGELNFHYIRDLVASQIQSSCNIENAYV